MLPSRRRSSPRRAGAPRDGLAGLAFTAAHAGGRQVLRLLGDAGTRARVDAADEHARDPVTAADLASDEAIRTVIGRRRPDDAWLTEESGARPGTSGLRWVVDPLDGTVNVTRGILRFAVSVAVESESDGAVLAAAVVQPASGEWLVLDDGTVKASSGQAPGVSAREPGRALVAFAVPSPPAARRAAYTGLAAVAPRVQDLRNFGSTVCDLAAVATGRLDGFLSVDAKPWDLAAGVALVEAAGGTSRRWHRSDGLCFLAVGGAAVVDALHRWTDE
ncbi:inositol monophosphatase family protein [Actinomadura syzygii]|uniref:inositol-phosphate phosphatase n=1 Tax=Actinomadura syzygii TaxID=1427538 RepID=A0A5D0TXQ7_9ACTN|nr:inositol monophosphatase family protein [Actinomadura syzygii]TYC10524.1 inositol monophosphatase family protein [Actinomadura syzygii]